MKRYLLLITLFCNCFFLFSQSSVYVEKPGKLEKTMKKKDIPLTVKELQIEGILNDDDFVFISSLSDLEILKLINVEFDANSKKNKGKFINDKVLLLSGFPSLVKLYLINTSGDYYNLSNIFIRNNSLKKLQYLQMPSNVALSTDYPNGAYNLVELEYTKTNGYLKFLKQREFSKYKKYFIHEEFKTKNTSIIWVHHLILPSFEELYAPSLKYIVPITVKSTKDDKTMLTYWHDTFNQSALEKVDSLAPGIFSGSNLKQITIPSNIKAIPRNCFKDCRGLKEVEMEGVTDIKQYAFSGTALTKVTIPSTIKEIEDLAFDGSKINEIIFSGQYPPVLYFDNEKNYDYDLRGIRYKRNTNIDLSFLKGCDIIIPKNSRSNYSIGYWKELPLKEPTETSEYKFIVEKPGTLNSIITNEIKRTATSISLKGNLYDTDLEIINQCTHLRYLDLSNTFISISPETLKKKQAEREFLSELFSNVADAAKEISNEQYNNGKEDLSTHVRTHVDATILKKASESLNSKEAKSDPSCIIPGVVFSELKTLKYIKLPLQLASLSNLGLSAIETIILPPSLERIEKYAFANYENLKTIEIPASVKHIGSEAFKGCKSLEVLDLSKTSIEDLYSRTFDDMMSLKELRLPKTIKKASCFISGSINVYCDIKEAPEGLKFGPKVILHIPKGTKPGWINACSEYVTITEM